MKEVLLKIEGIQTNADGEESVIEMVTEGKFYNKSDAIYLVYKETELSGMEGCVTTVKLADDKIFLKRFGPMVSEMIFEQGKRYAASYSTPYGELDLEVHTKRATYAISDANKGNIYIEYEIKLEGITESRNRLNIQIM
ncbi:MAG TPA: DUF1934 domain-containing protein [Clostridiales bacterium]|nr:DUF1934 domain-containing protein [Clostridiales bacterium]